MTETDSIPLGKLALLFAVMLIVSAVLYEETSAPVWLVCTGFLVGTLGLGVTGLAAVGKALGPGPRPE